MTLLQAFGLLFAIALIGPVVYSSVRTAKREGRRADMWAMAICGLFLIGAVLHGFFR